MLKKLKKYSRPKLNGFYAVGPHSLRFRDPSGNVTSLFKSSHATCSYVFRSRFIKTHNSRVAFRRFYRPQRLTYRFIGKAYRLKYKENVIFMRFHRSHKTHFYYTNINITTTKNKGFRLTLFKTHKEWLHIKYRLSSVRRRNLFTARGLWSTKTLYYKKKGKISGYR